MEELIMLSFNYLYFKEELRQSSRPDKREIMERWDKISSAKSLKEEPYYAYLQRFKVNDIAYKIPEEVAGDFDWQLLFQLVAASFSSDYQLSYPSLDDPDAFTSENEELPELCITVESGNASVTKTISELWSFQLYRLFEIYCEEQINLHSLKCENDDKENAVEIERGKQLKKFNHCKTTYFKHKNDLRQRKVRQKILQSF